MELGAQMHSFAKEHDLGRVFHAPFDVLFSDTDVVQPDLLFVSREREHIRTPANIQGAPDLIVEILSPVLSQDATGDHKRESICRATACKSIGSPIPSIRIVSVMLLQDGVLEIRRDLHRRRYDNLRHPRRLQHQPERHFLGLRTWLTQFARVGRKLQRP